MMYNYIYYSQSVITIYIIIPFYYYYYDNAPGENRTVV